MAEGTGLDIFRESFPDRFFDVGIAEQHAVTFAGGLALGGARPVAAIYSTFLQRAYDQVIHDIALQSIPVVFAMDRAGLVGEDGPTHHGQFDLSYLLCVPNLVVSAPKDGDELRDLLYTALQQTEAPFLIRYPRESIPCPLTEGRPPRLLHPGTWEVLEEGEGVALLAVGSTVVSAQRAAQILSPEGLRPGVVNCRFVKPLDQDTLDRLAARYGTLVTLEENALEGGFGAAVAGVLSNRPGPVPECLHLGLSDRFYVHGPRSDLLDGAGLSPESIARRVREAWADRTVTS
jgi:1-deoxy-D-xylulose-5-phosphate synthase